MIEFLLFMARFLQILPVIDEKLRNRDKSMLEFFLFVIVVLSTNIIQGITGFAGTVLAMPFTILLFGIDVAKPSLTILTTLACVLIVIRNFKNISWKTFFHMFVLMFIGVFIGEYLYHLFQPSILLQIYAVFVICVAVSGLLKKKERSMPDSILSYIVVLAGIIHGMFISGGPLLIIYAVRKLPRKEEFRATLSLIWISLNIYLMYKQFTNGLMTVSTLQTTALAIPALFAGVFIGGRLAGKMSQETFLKLTYILLVISGATLLFN